MRATRYIPSLSAVLLLGGAVASAQSTASKFEGVLTIQLTGANQATEAQYSVKGDRMRMDVQMGGMPIYLLLNAAEGKVVSVLPMQRMYMEQPIPTFSATGTVASAEKAKVQWTGKKETIAEHQCEHATLTDDTGQSLDLCAAKDLGSFLMGGPGGRSGSSGWQAGLGPNVFPLKVINSSGATIFEVTKIEKKTLDAALFQLPDGFQKMDMPMGRPPLR